MYESFLSDIMYELMYLIAVMAQKNEIIKLILFTGIFEKCHDNWTTGSKYRVNDLAPELPVAT